MNYIVAETNFNEEEEASTESLSQAKAYVDSQLKIGTSIDCIIYKLEKSLNDAELDIIQDYILSKEK